jgi:hypothetical protein
MKRATVLLAMVLCIGLLVALLTTKRSSSAAPVASKLSMKVGAVAVNPPALPLLDDPIDKFRKKGFRLVPLDENGAALHYSLQSAIYQLNSQPVRIDDVVYSGEIFQDPSYHSYSPYSQQGVLIDFRYQPQFDLRN